MFALVLSIHGRQEVEGAGQAKRLSTPPQKGLFWEEKAKIQTRMKYTNFFNYFSC
jgi:hypothetical protein